MGTHQRQTWAVRHMFKNSGSMEQKRTVTSNALSIQKIIIKTKMLNALSLVTFLLS